MIKLGSPFALHRLASSLNPLRLSWSTFESSPVAEIASPPGNEWSQRMKDGRYIDRHGTDCIFNPSNLCTVSYI